MPLTTLPTKTDGSLGRVKSDSRATEDLDLEHTAAEHEAIKTAIIDVSDEVGPHIGTVGTLNERVDALETPSFDVPESTARANSEGVSDSFSRADHVHDTGTVTVRVVNDATGILITDEVLLVDSSVGDIDVELPDSPPAPRWWSLKKTSTDANTIRLVRLFGTEVIEGVGADLALPGSTGTDRPSWTVLFDGTNWWVL